MLSRKLDPKLRVGELRRMLTGRGKMKMTDGEVRMFCDPSSCLVGALFKNRCYGSLLKVDDLIRRLRPGEEKNNRWD